MRLSTFLAQTHPASLKALASACKRQVTHDQPLTATTPPATHVRMERIPPDAPDGKGRWVTHILT